MKTKHFLILVGMICGMFWLGRESQSKTVAGNLNLALIVSTNQADGLDFATSEFNTSQASSTNFVPLTATQYLAARNYDLLNSYAQQAAAKRESKLVSDFRNATEARKISSENAVK